MAADAMPGFSWAAQEMSAVGDMFEEGQAFLGYPLLAALAQRAEYRRISETIARNMTRKWITLKARGEKDKTDRIKTINDAMVRFEVKDVFRRLAEQDGFYGRSHLYLDISDSDDDANLKTPIGDGKNDASLLKVAGGGLRGIRTVEAVWCYPLDYQTTNPLRADWYKPRAWGVMGKTVHSSRLLTFVGREVSDLLKPAYSFGGLSMSQIAKPYIDNWLRTRQSVSDILHSFTVFVLKGNMREDITLGGDGSQMAARAALFNATRDNAGVMLIDKTDEDFSNVAAPLSGLHELQSQAQEQQASVSGIPLVELLGIQPTGLNASSDGEISTFHGVIHAAQENLFRPNLERVINFIQLSECGDVDPDITFDFEPLDETGAKELADIGLVVAQTDAAYIDAGVIDPHEARVRLAADPKGPYLGLDPDDMPAPAPSELTGPSAEGEGNADGASPEIQRPPDSGRERGQEGGREGAPG